MRQVIKEYKWNNHLIIIYIILYIIIYNIIYIIYKTILVELK